MPLSSLWLSFVASWCKGRIKRTFLYYYQSKQCIHNLFWFKILLVVFFSPQSYILNALKLRFSKCRVLKRCILSMILFCVSFSTCVTCIHVYVENQDSMTSHSYSLNKQTNKQKRDWANFIFFSCIIILVNIIIIPKTFNFCWFK